jgi:hypothetical protein
MKGEIFMIVELKSLLPEIAEILSEKENTVRENAFPVPDTGAAFFQMPPETAAFDEIPAGSSGEKEYAGARITFLLEQLVGISERNAVFTEKTAELLEQQETIQSPSFS